MKPKFQERYMENRNAIKIVQHNAVTKQELLNIINKTFPDNEVGNYGQVAQITTIEMDDMTRTQSICFGKILEV